MLSNGGFFLYDFNDAIKRLLYVKKEVICLAAIVYVGSFSIIAVALLLIAYNFFDLRKRDEGRADMVELAAIIREGASTFLKQEYLVIVPIVILFVALYSLFNEKSAGIAFVFGAILNTTAAIIGMKAQTYGNVRTTNAAFVTKAESRTMRVALIGGSVGGFSVPAFGLLGLLVVFLASGGPEGAYAYSTGVLELSTVATLAARLECFGLGYSLIGMFARIAGGIYTKSADISADIVGKNRHGFREDDPRMPNTVADFIGDMMNDAFGNFTDLGESNVASTVFCIIMATQLFADDPEVLMAACLYPILLSAGGLLSSIIGVESVIFINRKRVSYDVDGKEIVESRELKDIGSELMFATTASSVVITIVSLIGAWMIFGKNTGAFKHGFMSPFVAAMLGIVASVAIGKLAEFYTSAKYSPVKSLANMAFEGASFFVSDGDGLGNRSVFAPVLIVATAAHVAYSFCGGPYGLVIAAAGMLSFAGTTITIDAFGPIADNAGGIAEGCHLPPEVRKITDALDSFGNTSAAIGKGNAIGSAAFVTMAELYTYAHLYVSGVSLLDALQPMLSGGIVGVGLVCYFCYLLGRNTNIAADILAKIGEAELDKEGVIEGTVRPDYKKVIRLAARNSLKGMLLPALIPFAAPVLFGFMFGPLYLFGILIGSMFISVGLALFHGNSGGAWDNAKKSIEERLADTPNDPILIAAHIVAVIGDTIGDIRKDVLAVCLDIFIKIMCNEAIVLGSLIVLYHLF